jgi:hypothetical protein
VNPLKGKFRSFLVASVQNFLSDEADRARRKRRGGDREFVRMDAESAEERYRLEPVDTRRVTPASLLWKVRSSPNRGR